MEENLTDAPASEETAPQIDLGESVSAPSEQVADSGPSVPEKFTVTVGGEPMEVSLEEALNGYQRQADYTRKTQELASEREQLGYAQRLWDAIDQNPQAVIPAIAEAYGISLGQAQQMVDQAQEEPEDLDPEEQRLRNVEQFMEQAQMAQVQAQLDREMVNLHQTYGQFDDQELLNFAVQHSIPDLEAAFKAFAFDRVTKYAADAKVKQQKATAPPVAGGHGVTQGSVSSAPASSLPSIRDAFEAALAAHGEG